MIGGFVVSLVVFAVGAILDFAVTASTYQHGFNIRTVGLILMIVGAFGGIALSLRRPSAMADGAVTAPSSRTVRAT